jgi:hypothetical protein
MGSPPERCFKSDVAVMLEVSLHEGGLQSESQESSVVSISLLASPFGQRPLQMNSGLKLAHLSDINYSPFWQISRGIGAILQNVYAL